MQRTLLCMHACMPGGQLKACAHAVRRHVNASDCTLPVEATETALADIQAEIDELIFSAREALSDAGLIAPV
jgi:hypothetical protein